MVGMKYPPIPICCIPPICCILIPAMRWMYWLARGAFLASSGEEKQTKPKPLDRPSSHITLAEVMV